MLLLSRYGNTIKVKVEVAADLWHLEKVIKSGDIVEASTRRKFVTETGKAERKPVFITLRAEKVAFHKPSNKLRVLGVIISGKPIELVSIGSHHSIEVEEGTVLSIQKTHWKKYELNRLKEAQRAARRPKLHVLTLDERDAELFVIKEYGVESLGSVNIGGRGKYKEETKKQREKYHLRILDLIKAINDIKRIVIAGPGFEREEFAKYLREKTSDIKPIVFPLSNIGKPGIIELVTKGMLDKIVRESRYAAETKAINNLIAEISKDGKATYGIAKVKEALNCKAVNMLLVIDSLLFERPAEVEPLLDAAEKQHSSILIISHENESSEKLKSLGGVAALLRFYF